MWCAACRELDEKTWKDPKVRQKLDGFVPVKLDLSENNSETKTIQNRYRIVGMPTVIVLDNLGKELYRFEGFKSPEEVLEILRRF